MSRDEDEDDDEPRDLFDEVERMQRGVLPRRRGPLGDETRTVRRRLIQGNWSHFEEERQGELDDVFGPMKKEIK
jgi:hypothetical protein